MRDIRSSRFSFSSLNCALFILAVVLFFPACSPREEMVFKESRVLMDTLVTITVSAPSEQEAKKAIGEAFSEIGRLEGILNFYSPSSEISLINRNAGVSKVRVSPDVLKLIDRAVYVSGMTEGAFDITIGPLSSLYNFHEHLMPDDRTILSRLALINYRDIVVDHAASAIYLKRKGMLIDTGGIAKGYAADRAAEVLRKGGIRAGIVAVAGDIRTFGLRPDGKPWRIGIRNPFAKDGDSDEVFATLELTDMAISTSGDYERFFFARKKRYHHLLDPKTGHPSDACRSVSVVAKEGVLTDAFSTAVFVLGPDKGMKLLERMGFGGIVVDNNGKTHLTPNMRGKVEFKGTSS